MKRVVFFLFLFLFSTILYADLASKWEIEKKMLSQNSTELAEIKELLSTKQAILVTGYLTEAIDIFTNYFEDNIKVLEKEFGIHCTVLEHSSHSTVQDNAASLAGKILKLYETNGHKPIILIGHSKGGAESLLVALENHHFLFNNIIDRIILIQGAIGGSPVADTLSSNWFEYLTGNFIGLRALRTSNSRSLFLAKLSELKQKITPPEFTELSNRIYYVRAYKERVTPVLKITHSILFKQGGVNDGLLLPKDQFMTEIGTDLGVLIADHSDLTVTKPLSLNSAESRYAFTRALMKEIYNF